MDWGRLDQRVRELIDGDEILERVVGAILSVRREVLDRLDELHRMVLTGEGRSGLPAAGERPRRWSSDGARFPHGGGASPSLPLSAPTLA